MKKRLRLSFLGLEQGDSERVASFTRGPRARVVLDQHPNAAIRKLAFEAADNELLDPELAAGISP